MAEREILDDLAERTGLLLPRENKPEQEQRVAKFTRIAAWLLRDKGWGNVKKTGGTRVDNKSVDKLIHRDTGVVVDIVGKSDGPTPEDSGVPRVSWTPVDKLDPKEYFVEPVNEEGEQPPVNEPEPPRPDDDDLGTLLEAYARVVDGLTLTRLSLDNVNTRVDTAVEGLSMTKLAIDQLNARIDEIKRDGVRVRLR